VVFISVRAAGVALERIEPVLDRLRALALIRGDVGEEGPFPLPREDVLMGGIFSFPGCVILCFIDRLEGIFLRASK